LKGIRIHARSAIGEPRAPGGRDLRRDLARLLAVKFAALGLLWFIFFSPAHQPAVDASAASQRLAVAATVP
jgi:hypothetical protein